MRAMKLNDYFMSFGLILFCFAIFFCLSFTSVAAKINLDLAALIFTILCQVGIFLNKRNPLLRIRIKDRIMYLYKDVMFKGIQEVLVFFISLLVSYGLRTIIISSEWLSKISIAILFLGLLIDIWKKDQ